jgi:leader peptidase (prepilin peptidase)/N-methyltransferase
MAAAGLVALLGTVAEPYWLLASAIGLAVAWIALQDIVDFTIPDGAIIALAMLGVASRLSDSSHVGEPLARTVLAIAVDIAVSGGLLLALREAYYHRRGHDGLGFGDVKLGAAGGALAGTSGFAWALFAASLAGIAVVMACRMRPLGRLLPEAPEKLPFGAILAPALWVVWAMRQSPDGSGLFH